MSSPASEPIFSNKLFAGIAPEVLQQLVRIPEPLSLPADQVIFAEGDPADYLYLLVEGTVRVSKLGRGGQQETLRLLHGGDFFGEMAMADREPRSARISTVTPVRLARVDQHGFTRLLNVAPGEIALNLTREIVVRLRESNMQFMQELLRAERLSMIGTMAAAVAHDYNNPIATILVNTELLEEMMPGDAVREYTSSIRKSLERMGTLTRDLLDFVRGNPRLDLRRVSVGDLLSDLDEQILARLPAHGIEVRRDIRFDDVLTVDASRLNRALLNLIKNAAEAMPDGGTLDLRVEARGDQLAIEIADTGPGIPTDFLPSLFEPFSTRDKRSGTGLGTAIARSIVQAHRGEVSVLRTSSAGTCMAVVLPRHTHYTVLLD